MVCKKCGKEFEGTFCPYCGEKAGEGLPSECPVCGNPRKEDEIFCSKCGYSYVARNQAAQETHPRSGIKLDIFSGEKAAKVFAGIGKAWWLVEGVGTLLLGVLVLLSLSAPIMLHMGYDVSANGFVNAFTINVDGGFTAICVVLLAIAIFLILGGLYRFFRAWKFPYGEVSSLKSWFVDGVVVAALVVLGSIGVGKAGEWLGSPGAGLSFCVVLGVFGIIFFVFRILFETKYIDIEQKEAVGAKVKQSKLSAKSGKIAFNIKVAIVLLMTAAIVATLVAVPVKFVAVNPLNKSALGFEPYYTSKSSIMNFFGFSEDDGENRTSITFYSPEYENMERMIDRLNEVSGEDLFGDFDEDMSEDDFIDSMEGMMGVSELVEQMEEKSSKMQYQFTTITFTARNDDHDTSDLVFESAIHNASAGYQDEEEDAPTRELVELTVRENGSSHSSYGKRYTNQAVVYYDAEFSDGSFIINGKATAYTADDEVFTDYENAKTVTWSDDLYDEYSCEIDKIKDEDSIPATRYWYYNTVTDQLVLTGGDTGIIAEKLTGDWSSYLRAVRGIVIDGDVSISDNAFEGLRNLSSVTFNDGGSIFHVGKDAFVGTAYWNDIDNWQDGQLYVGDWLVGLRNVPGGEFEIDEDLKYAEGFLAKATGVTTLILHTADYDTISDMLGYQGSNSEVKRFELFPRSVKNIVIADGVEEIDSMAFSGFDKITSVTIPDSVTSIGREAFSGCSGLTSVTIPDSVTSINMEAFSGCSGLTSITIPFVGEKADGTGVTDFGYIFYVIDLWDDVYNIPESLKEVIITGGESIGDRAFEGYNGLTSVTIENGVTSIGYRAFRGCSGLTSVTIGNGVTSIGDEAFRGCSGLTSITIPDGVTSIGEYAFAYCSGLTSVTIGDGVTSIGSSAFSQCTSLQFNEHGGAKYLGNEVNPYVVLYDVTDTSVTSFEIMAQTKIIYDGAFSGCSGLTSIVIPDSVTSIGYAAFEGCSGLTSVTIGNSVTSIGDYAFRGCSSLTSVTIGNGVTSIGEYAFSGCGGLTSVTIGNSVTSIGSRAFSGCSGLTSITIPDSVTGIGYGAFAGCSGLTSITIPFVGEKADGTGSTSFDYIFVYSDYDVPESLKEVIITGGESIADGAFEGCTSLTTVTIPDTVTTLGDNVFEGCTSLEKIIFKGTIEQWKALELSSSGNDKLVVECSDGRYKFFVTYDLDGGVNAASNPSSYTRDTLGGADGSIALAAPTKLYDSNGDGTFEVAPDGYTFLGWYKDPSFEQKVEELTLDLGDVTLYAKWGEPVSQTSTVQVYTREGDYIYFGKYPQTLKADNVTVGDVADEDGYYLGSDGERYAKVVADPYGSGYTFLDGSAVTEGNTYYFKVEPIRWRILSESDGSAFILADGIIANHYYHHTSSSTTIDGEKVYANNYKHSDIRAWLNGEFMNTAFGEVAQGLIETTEVDNSVYSTGYSSNKYACENTFDKVFLLSYGEVTNNEYGFASDYSDYDTARSMTVSDYARSTGAYMNTSNSYFGCGYWWLRSPSFNDSYYARYVNRNGYVDFNYFDYNAHYYIVSDGNSGVVPALNIIL